MRIKEVMANIGVWALLCSVSTVFLGLLIIGIPMAIMFFWPIDRIFSIVLGAFYAMGVYLACYHLVVWIVTGKNPPW